MKRRYSLQRTTSPISLIACAALAALIGLVTITGVAAENPAGPSPRWFKGNLHTHTLWSDGDDFPEMVVDWYRREGYQFLALSDHNVLQEGTRWINIGTNGAGTNAVQKYLARFGANWVETRDKEAKPQVRLKPLSELRSFFERPGEFLLIPAMELTDRHLTAPIHMNVTNVRDPIAAQGGSNVLEVMQRNVDAVLEQRRRTGQPMIPHLNHPNFGWGVTAEELMRVRGERFFEVYNGHPSVNNEGDYFHAGTDRMWDIILTWRLAVLGMEPIYGIGVDDSHNYHVTGHQKSLSGRGWIMVHATHLTPEKLIEAMEKGEFYASSGVTLRNIQRGPKRYEVEVEAEPGADYQIEFFGTRKGFDQTNEPVRTTGGEALRVTHRYSPEVGRLLLSQKGPRGSYPIKGDELYVRARVTSSRPMRFPVGTNDVQRAWTQPFVPVPAPEGATKGR